MSDPLHGLVYCAGCARALVMVVSGDVVSWRCPVNCGGDNVEAAGSVALSNNQNENREA